MAKSLSRGLVLLMAIMAAIQLCSHQQAEATIASASVSWGEPCSAEAKAKIEKCMKEETTDIDKCCSILHSVMDDSCPCWVHAKITNRQLANIYIIYCDMIHPLCSTPHQAM